MGDACEIRGDCGEDTGKGPAGSSTLWGPGPVLEYNGTGTGRSAAFRISNDGGGAIGACGTGARGRKRDLLSGKYATVSCTELSLTGLGMRRAGARGLKGDALAGKDALGSRTGCGVCGTGARGLRVEPPAGKNVPGSRTGCSVC